MADYVELEALKDSLSLSGETFADDDLALAITAASAAVESYCGRRFTLDSEDQTRTYRSRRFEWIEIDDLVALTSIESDTYGDGTFTAWTLDDYDLEPTNAVADDTPYTALRLKPHSSRMFYPNETIVHVTGKFGWPEVPASVQEATFILAARLTKRVRESPFGIAGIGADGIPVRLGSSDPDIGLLLSPFAKTIRLA